MENKILEKLQKIEEEKKVEILFAIESGSRAWGFESPDSDYDIRFVYKHKKDWYLNLWDSKDTIQFMTKEDLDGSGWDLRKAFQLLAKSNSSFLGWLFSPIVYCENKDVLNQLKKLAIENFNPVAGFYHYDSMSKSCAEKLSLKNYTIKDFFYAIRTALCANWILKKETIPPVEFLKLCELLESSEMLLLKRLIEVKGESDEKSMIKVPKQLIELTFSLIEENREKKYLIKKKQVNKEMFNDLFLKILE